MTPRKFTLPTDSAERKAIPLYTALFRCFPAALAAIAKHCEAGNQKHNPGEEMHHARWKSFDHADCILRHLIDLGENGGLDPDGVPQVAYIAWRALALAQEWLEKNEGAPLAPGAKLAPETLRDRVATALGARGGHMRRLGRDRRFGQTSYLVKEKRVGERRAHPRIAAEALAAQFVEKRGGEAERRKFKSTRAEPSRRKGSRGRRRDDENWVGLPYDKRAGEADRRKVNILGGEHLRRNLDNKGRRKGDVPSGQLPSVSR